MHPTRPGERDDAFTTRDVRDAVADLRRGAIEPTPCPACGSPCVTLLDGVLVEQPPPDAKVPEWLAEARVSRGRCGECGGPKTDAHAIGAH